MMGGRKSHAAGLFWPFWVIDAMGRFGIEFGKVVAVAFQEKCVVLRSSRARSMQQFAIWLLLAMATAQAALAAPNFSLQRRVGYTAGDQWEPALAADGHGHIYILFPQYGAVRDCRVCAIPTMVLLVSNDNGASWERSEEHTSELQSRENLV